MFASAAAADRAVLLPYMTAGLPNPRASATLFTAMAEAGADGFEVGIPYSDPLMDGPVIQEAGAVALAAGTSLDGSLDIVAQVVEATGKPVIVMTYVNPVLRVGPGAFAGRVAEAGACGMIVADLPADEADEIRAAAEAEGLGMVLFAAPTTDPDRLAQIAASRPAFVYGIADLGVTGVRTETSSHAAALAARVRAVTDAPLVLGVGISTPDQARAAAAVADGVIVGSALVQRVLDAENVEDAAEALRKGVAELAEAMKR
jgi:tryptophan synthase alpha chain